MKFMIKQDKDNKGKKKKTQDFKMPINKQNIQPSIYQKKVTNVNDSYFKETECLMMIKP